MDISVADNNESAYCATRYPILLVHGVSLRDGEKGRIWGRIPQTLRIHGARVFVGGQDGWGTPDGNAYQLHDRIRAVLAETGAAAVNVIAHSKGGIDIRHLIKLYEDGTFDNRALPIATLTTISTPHHGSHTLDALYSRFRPIFRTIAFFIDGIYRIAGDTRPDFYTVCSCLTSSYMEEFNRKQPALSSLYSQQFAGSLKGIRDSLASLFTYPIIKRFEGSNDGLVTLGSAAFDNFRGEITTTTGRGIAHAGLVDIMRSPFGKGMRSGMVPTMSPDHRTSSTSPVAATTRSGGGIRLQVGDILDFYISLVADLKARGY